MRKFLVFLLSLSLLIPLPAFAVDQAELLQKIEALSKELERLKQQMQEMQKREEAKEERIAVVEKKAEQAAEGAGPFSWLEISGDYRGRLDSLKGNVHDYMQYDPNNLYGPFPLPVDTYFFTSPQDGYKVRNDTVLTNRLGLNLKVKATEDIQVKARLLMYKVWGHETMTPVQGNFFADRAFGPFDGVVAHVPSDNALRVDQAYATWANIADLPIWFSVGRRPSTGGVPDNLRQNTERIGTAGIPKIMVDYAFDGLSFGVMPDIEALPGAYLKICYGRGFDSGFKSKFNSVKDTDFLGVNLVPYDTDNLHVELQWQRGWNIFNTPSDGMNQKIDMGGGNFITVNTPVSTNLGNIDWFGGVVTGKIDKLGPGNLNLFASAAMSKTHPNNNLFSMPFGLVDPDGTLGNGDEVVFNAGFGLLYDEGEKRSRTGSAVYIGARYDLPTGTKIGAEYNHGSKYWIGMVPAADDIWTSKLGTRGDVYEAYVIQELGWLKPISKKGKAFFRLGYQYYKFAYTGSNSWIGEPKKIKDLDTTDPSKTQLLAPLKNAQNIYLTFDVQF